MASSFGGVDLFGSGPHRFRFEPRGLDGVSLAAIFQDASQAGTAVIGDEELKIVVEGRLVAASEAGLWSLREAVAGAAAQSAGSATLIDEADRSFEQMWLDEYAELGAVDRGRVYSIAYSATFVRLLGSV